MSAWALGIAAVGIWLQWLWAFLKAVAALQLGVGIGILLFAEFCGVRDLLIQEFPRLRGWL